MALLNYDEFSARVHSLLSMTCPLPINPYQGLYDELALDSLQAFQLVVVTEALADVDVPPSEIPAMFTMQDAFDYYVRLRSSELST